MVATKGGESSAVRKYRYSGKLLVAIEENGHTVWDIVMAARAMREAVEQGDVELSDDPCERFRFIREYLRQSQDGFAELLGVPTGTIRNWEQGRREPDAPARALIRIVSTHPDVMIDSVRGDLRHELECT